MVGTCLTLKWYEIVEQTKNTIFLTVSWYHRNKCWRSWFLEGGDWLKTNTFFSTLIQSFWKIYTKVLILEDIHGYSRAAAEDVHVQLLRMFTCSCWGCSRAAAENVHEQLQMLGEDMLNRSYFLTVNFYKGEILENLLFLRCRFPDTGKPKMCVLHHGCQKEQIHNLLKYTKV